jgi:hypothetical protein
MTGWLRQMVVFTGLSLCCWSCTKGVPVRTPECDAEVNRCLEQCKSGASSQEPRNAGYYNPTGANSTSSSCEMSCNHC